MTAKTSTERGRERRKRLEQQGYKEVRNLWVLPHHEKLVREHAKDLVLFDDPRPQLRRVDIGKLLPEFRNPQPVCMRCDAIPNNLGICEC